ncbi:serine protease [Polycladomyces sp. WAk]|uniref:Serine protease n=1 Tax=Polycladomyces zharkentensis TaxID=2807616 RepID=A0ABS2WKE8_9BACL|nr:serine protease [Polycladomyces sp. WAk]MBN2909999.1 serine protease [Polycladomyces sp. WAk]
MRGIYRGLAVLCVGLATVVTFLSPVSGSVEAREKSIATNNALETPVTQDGRKGFRKAEADTSGMVKEAGGKAAYVPGYRGTGKGHASGSDPFVSRSIGIDSVIGTDDRTKVSNTTSYPYSAVVKIETDVGECTGWLIGPHTVATAGHCVFDPDLKRWVSWARVYPGKNGSTNPFGVAYATGFRSVVGWTQDLNHEYDYGAIQLDRDIGYQTGWFGYRWQSWSYSGEAETIVGYPGSKDNGTTMWKHTDKIWDDSDTKLYYKNDTSKGQSGAPVWQTRSGCGECGIGIHAYGLDPAISSIYNSGTRINEVRFNNLTDWRNEPLQ